MNGSQLNLSNRHIIKNVLALKSIKIVKEFMQNKHRFESVEKFISDRLNKYKSNLFLVNDMRLSISLDEKRKMLDFVYSNWKFIRIDESIAYEYIQSINTLYRKIYRHIEVDLGRINDLSTSINKIWSYLDYLNVDIYCEENIMMFDKVEFIEIEIRDKSLVEFCGKREYIDKYIQDAVYFLYPTAVIMAVEYKNIIKVLICDGVFEKSILDRYDNSILTELIMQSTSLMIKNKIIDSMTGE